MRRQVRYGFKLFPEYEAKGASPCQVSVFTGIYTYVDWFWFDLEATLFHFYPKHSLIECVEEASLMAAKHAADNIYCFKHGRSYSDDGRCPHEVR